MMGLILLPKCPLCFAMWLSAIGMTGVSGGRVQASLVGLLLLLMIFSGVKLLSLWLSSTLALAAALAGSRNSAFLDGSARFVGQIGRRIDSALLRVVLVLHIWTFKVLATIFPGLIRPGTRFKISVDFQELTHGCSPSRIFQVASEQCSALTN
jgi:hypothetical protein